MSSSETIEVTAATVETAISQALEQLGALEDDVTIEVLSTPRTGVLGLGARPARVRVTRRAPEAARSGVMSPPPAPQPPPAPRQVPSLTTPMRERPARPTAVRERTAPVHERAAPPARSSTAAAESEDIEKRVTGRPLAEPAADSARRVTDLAEQTRQATAILTRILELMGEKTEIEQVHDADTVELNIKGDGSGLLIGRHGQTLDALEYLVNRALARQVRDAAPISVDTESYRARRRQQLHRMALSKGEQAKREHVPVMLDPMPPRDRRIIHLALKDDPLITTRSSGDSFLRSIQIVPVDERREGAGGRGGRDHRRERERPAPSPSPTPSSVGESGGFKRGQKRIV
jgi:spoIIIJ-associated protein